MTLKRKLVLNETWMTMKHQRQQCWSSVSIHFFTYIYEVQISPCLMQKPNDEHVILILHSILLYMQTCISKVNLGFFFNYLYQKGETRERKKKLFIFHRYTLNSKQRKMWLNNRSFHCIVLFHVQMFWDVFD